MYNTPRSKLSQIYERDRFARPVEAKKLKKNCCEKYKKKGKCCKNCPVFYGFNRRGF